ncbi:hypothetical protein A6R68_22163, partial [Neotoma lepida]
MWSGRSSFTSLVVGVFVVYVVHTCWVMYGIVYTRPCSGDSNCIQPYLARRPKLQLSVYTTTRSSLGAENNVDLVLNVEDFDVESKFEREPMSSQQQIEAEKKPSNALDEPVSHWRPRLTLNVMVDDFVFDGSSLPADVHRYMKMIQLGKTVHYLPILFIDQLSNRVKDLMQQIEAEKKPSNALDEPVSHWRPRLTLNVMVDDFVFDGSSLPADVHRYMKMIQLGKTVHYLPILFIDQLSNRVKDLM